MAERTAQPTPKGNTLVYLWEALLGASVDTGEKVLGFDYGDITIQIIGNFGVGGSINLEGSNDDGVTWAILNDPFENPLTFTAAGLAQVTEACKHYRVNVTAGNGSTDLDAYLFMRRQR